MEQAPAISKMIRWEKPVILVVSLLLAGWLVNTPGGLLGKADAVAYAVCHRIEVRSFYIGDRQLPLCARCTGMYLGAMLGLAYQAITGRKRAGAPPWKLIVILCALGVAFAVDGLNSFIHFFPGAPSLYEPNNTLRLLTGSGMGLAISAALFPAFNQTVWMDYDPSPALSGWRSLGGMLILAILIDLAVLSGNPLALYPLALVSASGVIVLLTMVYSMVWLIVFRAENCFLQVSQMRIPLVSGFGVALLQIALLDFVRFLLTGTWSGFHLV
jgi:uncharacterized membrane protein